MTFKFNLNSKKAGSSEKRGFKPLLFLMSFFKRLKISYLLMSKVERWAAILLVLIAVFLIGYKYLEAFKSKTVLIPAVGGKYSEALIGEVKYLNPIVSQTDAEKSISKLIFSGLIKIESNQPVPDLAERWEISDSGNIYTFYLRKDAKFSDGTPITANDVAYTVSSIQAPEVKSFLNKSFEGVSVKVIDDYTLAFELPSTYGPFIYYCDFGILPSHLSSEQFAKELIGSGPYKYLSMVKNEKGEDIKLGLNDNYYLAKPKVAEIDFKLFTDKDAARKWFNESKEPSGLFGINNVEAQKFNFSSSRKLGLIFNLRKDKLKDKALREKILGTEILSESLSLMVTTLDLETQRQKAEEIKAEAKNRNINIEINYLSPLKFQEVIVNKDYELLLYGFNFGYDRDPYAYWHSSQLDNLNLAGWSEKGTDILLEDARMIVDNTQRNAKYDEFFNRIQTESLVKFFDPLEFNFSVKNINGVALAKGTAPASRFDTIADWYIKEKRVKK